MNRRNFLRSLATAALAAAARTYPLAQTAIAKPFEPVSYSLELGRGTIFVRSIGSSKWFKVGSVGSFAVARTDDEPHHI